MSECSINAMLDLETLGNGPQALIKQIGVAIFCEQRLEVLDSLQIDIDPASHQAMGGQIDAATINWWLDQPQAARARMQLSGMHIAKALDQTTAFLAKHASLNDIKVWGNDPSFDLTILRSAYRATGHDDQPWQYFNQRCYRTLKAMHPSIGKPREGTLHIAADDALSQAHHVVKILKHQGQQRDQLAFLHTLTPEQLDRVKAFAVQVTEEKEAI